PVYVDKCAIRSVRRGAGFGGHVVEAGGGGIRRGRRCGWLGRGSSHVWARRGCRIGAPLARIELQAVFTQLMPCYPTMRLAVGVDKLTLRRDTLVGGLVELW